MRVLQFLVLSIAFLSLPSFAAIGPQNLWGYIDKTGNFVITPRYRFAEKFHGGRALADDQFIDKTGQTVGPEYVDGVAVIGNDEHGIFVDRAGHQIGQPYEYLGKFCDGLAPMVPNASPCVCVCVLCRVRAARRRPTECRNSAIDRYTLTFSIFDYASVIAGAQCHAI